MFFKNTADCVGGTLFNNKYWGEATVFTVDDGLFSDRVRVVHERPDGKGYPNHLKGDEIPRVAQIIAVADCFDAMYSNRPYRNRMNFEKVVSIIKEVAGTQLAPDVVDAFLRLVDKGEFRSPDDDGGGSMENIENIRKKNDDPPSPPPAS